MKALPKMASANDPICRGLHDAPSPTERGQAPRANLRELGGARVARSASGWRAVSRKGTSSLRKPDEMSSTPLIGRRSTSSTTISQVRHRTDLCALLGESVRPAASGNAGREGEPTSSSRSSPRARSHIERRRQRAMRRGRETTRGSRRSSKSSDVKCPGAPPSKVVAVAHVAARAVAVDEPRKRNRRRGEVAAMQNSRSESETRSVRRRGRPRRRCPHEQETTRWTRRQRSAPGLRLYSSEVSTRR